MKKVSLNKEKLIKNVAVLLRETPSSSDIVIKDKKEADRYLYLARYMVEKAIRKDALIHDEDFGSIAIVFHKKTDEKENVLLHLWEDLKLAYFVTGLTKGLKALKTQRKIKSKYPKYDEYLYCWFLGVLPNERGLTDKKLAYQMKDRILAISKEKKLPLIAETRTKRIAIAYVRYGFKIIEKWRHPNGGDMYFLEYNPNTQ